MHDILADLSSVDAIPSPAAAVELGDRIHLEAYDHPEGWCWIAFVDGCPVRYLVPGQA